MGFVHVTASLAATDLVAAAAFARNAPATLSLLVCAPAASHLTLGGVAAASPSVPAGVVAAFP